MSYEVNAGDTVRLKAEFKNWAGELADPNPVKLRVYDAGKKLIGSEIELTNDNRTDTGLWFYDYTLPNVETTLYFEFTGVLEGKSIATRKGVLKVKWAT